ncbi:hypothetical protein L9F63_016159, partial [Diploptera punctata]
LIVVRTTCYMSSTTHLLYSNALPTLFFNHLEGFLSRGYYELSHIGINVIGRRKSQDFFLSFIDVTKKIFSMLRERDVNVVSTPRASTRTYLSTSLIALRRIKRFTHVVVFFLRYHQTSFSSFVMFNYKFVNIDHLFLLYRSRSRNSHPHNSLERDISYYKSCNTRNIIIMFYFLQQGFKLKWIFIIIKKDTYQSRKARAEKLETIYDRVINDPKIRRTLGQTFNCKSQKTAFVNEHGDIISSKNSIFYRSLIRRSCRFRFEKNIASHVVQFLNPSFRFSNHISVLLSPQLLKGFWTHCPFLISWLVTVQMSPNVLMVVRRVKHNMSKMISISINSIVFGDVN